MELKVRTARTLKVTEVKLTDEEREELAQLYMDPRYNALLNVMERACIEMDTALLNVAVGDPESILGGHAVAKAGWLWFTYTQKQVLNAYQTRIAEPEEEAGPPDLNDILQGVG